MQTSHHRRQSKTLKPVPKFCDTAFIRNSPKVVKNIQHADLDSELFEKFRHEQFPNSNILKLGLEPHDISDRLSRTQLQYMYIVESQRGSPALFVINSWFYGHNVDLFKWLIINNPNFTTSTVSLTDDYVGDLPNFDEHLRLFNTVVGVSVSKDYKLLPEWVPKSTLLSFKYITHMSWSRVAIDDQTLIIWAGPYRILEQPGAATYIHMNVLTTKAAKVTLDQNPILSAITDRLRVSLNYDMIKHIIPTAHDLNHKRIPPTLSSGDWSIMGQVAITNLRMRSWHSLCTFRSLEFANMFHFDSSINASVNNYQFSPLLVPRGFAMCCRLVAPFVQEIWNILYKNKPTLLFLPTAYSQYHDFDDVSPSTNPRVDHPIS